MKSGDLSANKNIQSGIRLALMADACNSRKVWVKIKDLHPQDCPLHFVSLVLIRQRRTDYFWAEWIQCCISQYSRIRQPKTTFLAVFWPCFDGPPVAGKYSRRISWKNLPMGIQFFLSPPGLRVNDDLPSSARSDENVILPSIFKSLEISSLLTAHRGWSVSSLLVCNGWIADYINYSMTIISFAYDVYSRNACQQNAFHFCR